MQKQVERSFFFTLYIERAYSSPQILMVLSDELLIIFVPSGLYDTEETHSECPSKVLRHFPVFASHILMVLSSEPLIIFVPSGLYATE